MASSRTEAASVSPLLQMNSISKAYAGVQALSDVSFELQAGEVHALVGENGAGKSTLIKILTGAVRPDTGIILIDGTPVPVSDPLHIRRLGVACIYQQPALFPDLSVAENLDLQHENAGWLGVINWTARRERAQQLLSRVGARLSPDSLVRELTMPEQQLVEIAKALGARAKILIMDEPTASLATQEVENLLNVIRELKTQGVGIIYVSHRLEELYEIANRVTVLRDGQHVTTQTMQEISQSELIRLMVGREISAVFPKQDVSFGDIVLETRGLCCRELGTKSVSLTIRAGEILGLVGLVGAGRTELARTLFGLNPADGGQILLHGKPIQIDSPRTAVAHGVAYVPEDRRRHGVILDLPISQNMTLAALHRVSSGGFLRVEQERRLANEFLNRLSVKAPDIDTLVGNLSGGNQQKVALSRWLAISPVVLILDEPTQGIDVGAKAEIHRLMGELARQGLAILMISSELPEILGMSDRIAVMRAGAIVGEFTRRDATPEKILELALGSQIAAVSV